MADPVSRFPYVPSQPLAGVTAGLFAASFLLTLFQIIRKRAWVWLVMLLSILMEIVGFAARIVSARSPGDLQPYSVQFALIILAPVLMAAVVYVVFSRIVFWATPPEHLTFSVIWVPPRFITLIFVGFDVVSLLLQMGAATMLSTTQATDENAEGKIEMGRNLGLAGVGVQLFGFGIFTVAAVRFHFTSRRFDGHHVSQNQTRWKISKHYESLLYVVNASCALILIRSVFRMVEFAPGTQEIIEKKEWYLYTFDVLPILIVCVLYNIWFPGDYLKHLGFRVPKSERHRTLDAESIASQQELTTHVHWRDESK
ncbi:unnamed protein product [Clonostachys chloroleuca]|uniref:Uncharacterized protein n=1 Tax=Clonostachys chloroleuca TaxID=1926264 RepID=A0AA35MAN9_9HYPO|nr:unnamed protein product [Clonostachys chloroleuca]